MWLFQVSCLVCNFPSLLGKAMTTVKNVLTSLLQLKLSSINSDLLDLPCWSFLHCKTLFLPLQKGGKVSWPNGALRIWACRQNPQQMVRGKITSIFNLKSILTRNMCLIGEIVSTLLGNIDIFFSDGRNNKIPISVWCNKFSYSDEINRLNERLREKGVDIETERKLEQVSIRRKVAISHSLCFNLVLLILTCTA